MVYGTKQKCTIYRKNCIQCSYRIKSKGPLGSTKEKRKAIEKL